jgi:hypothetical protein
MRENRPYGSEGGEAQTLPDPYRRWAIHQSRNVTARPAGWCPPSLTANDGSVSEDHRFESGDSRKISFAAPGSLLIRQLAALYSGPTRWCQGRPHLVTVTVDNA